MVTFEVTTVLLLRSGSRQTDRHQLGGGRERERKLTEGRKQEAKVKLNAM